MAEAFPDSLSRTITAAPKSKIDILESLQWVSKYYSMSPFAQLHEIIG
jgi:hypothetical protein